MIEQFKQHRVQREYWALSLKTPAPIKDTLETWMKRHPLHRKKFISLNTYEKGGKKAITSYELLQQSKSGISWIKCHLKTGRTHQIRVHLSSLSCPLLGDELYGGKKKLSFLKEPSLKEQIKNLNRTALHAHSLSFSHPLSFKKMSFHSPLAPGSGRYLKKSRLFIKDQFYKKLFYPISLCSRGIKSSFRPQPFLKACRRKSLTSFFKQRSAF